jgi:hypothetical protein
VSDSVCEHMHMKSNIYGMAILHTHVNTHTHTHSYAVGDDYTHGGGQNFESGIFVRKLQVRVCMCVYKLLACMLVCLGHTCMSICVYLCIRVCSQQQDVMCEKKGQSGNQQSSGNNWGRR